MYIWSIGAKGQTINRTIKSDTIKNVLLTPGSWFSDFYMKVRVAVGCRGSRKSSCKNYHCCHDPSGRMQQDRNKRLHTHITVAPLWLTVVGDRIRSCL